MLESEAGRPAERPSRSESPPAATRGTGSGLPAWPSEGARREAERRRCRPPNHQRRLRAVHRQCRGSAVQAGGRGRATAPAAAHPACTVPGVERGMPASYRNPSPRATRRSRPQRCVARRPAGWQRAHPGPTAAGHAAASTTAGSDAATPP
eukprot:scaffold3143_cov104-Isochrysis_galbana.AAC.9